MKALESAVIGLFEFIGNAGPRELAEFFVAMLIGFAIISGGLILLAWLIAIGAWPWVLVMIFLMWVFCGDA